MFDAAVLVPFGDFRLRRDFPLAVMQFIMGTTIASLMPQLRDADSTLSEPPGSTQSSSCCSMALLVSSGSRKRPI